MTKKFEQFTKQYSLSKTLRFELKPVGKTQKMLEENNVFEIDENRKIAYQKIKPYFDRLHREFVEEALMGVTLSGLEVYNVAFVEFKKTREPKVLEALRKELRSEITGYFNLRAKDWAERIYVELKLKKKDLNLLFEEQIFEILNIRYGDEDGTKILDNRVKEEEQTPESYISIFDSWKGFVGYFTKFFETRRNFYKDDGTSSAIATRAIDQNLDRFLDNLHFFEGFKNKLELTSVAKAFGKTVDEVFSVKFYNSCLLQKGIDEYNEFLGGKTLLNGEKIQGVNELINKYRQDHEGEKLPFLKKLDKQILSERESGFYVLDNEVDALLLLKEFQSNSEFKIRSLRNAIGRLVENINSCSLDKIFFSKEAINTISRKWTSETQFFQDNLYSTLKEVQLVKTKGKNDEEYKFPNFISFKHLRLFLDKVNEVTFWKEQYREKNIVSENQNGWQNFIKILEYEFAERFCEFENSNEILKGFLSEDNLKLRLVKGSIKEFADNALRTYQLGKYFAVEKKRAWDESYELDDFYTHPEHGYLSVYYPDAYERIVKPYNDVRNYLTKKPYSEEKWKLNFENPTLANGWDKNKEPNNTAVLLLKDNEYYLGLMKKGNNKMFSDKVLEEFLRGGTGSSYSKLIYKLLPGANKMLPKVFFSKSNIDYFRPSDDILRIRNHSSHTKGGDPQKGYEKKEFVLADCHKIIDFFKASLEKHEEWKDYKFEFSDTNSYSDTSKFYREVENQGYKLSFQDISDTYIEQKNKNGELYLFKINNKDWNEGSKGTKNLHTLYFESLFSEDNMKNNYPMKLNGQAEIFYRPKTDGLKKQLIETTKGEILKKGDKAFQKNRYTDDKMFFHVPITVNRTQGDVRNYNTKINDFLANNPAINVIGVDRGEKHLAYYSIINQRGEILDSGSLNSMAGGSEKVINYAEKLEAKAGDREQARKDWEEVEAIKNLKKGYISQVVRKLADLAIQHNAIIVFEDLNMRFKQIRGGIEKSVYQQLEKALIDKLNFLVNKGELDPSKAGHLLNAYQLAAPFESFQKMGKQTGVIFYTQASYTSKIDPITGWRPNLYLKYKNAEQAKSEIGKFDGIKYNLGQDRFEFTYDISSFVNLKEQPNKVIWTICSNVERFRWNRNLASDKGDYAKYKNVTDPLKTLFDKYEINYNDGDIRDQLRSLDAKGNEELFRQLILYINLICQIRNTNKDLTGNDNDFILSPVEPFFDSRKDNGAQLPKNGDDNGAYNIARKGLIILDKISKFANENGDTQKMKWGDLYISHVEWDNFASAR